MADGVHVRVGARRYAFDVASVREVQERGAVTPIPGAPRAVAGVRSLRGSVLAVIELATVLGADDLEPGAYIVVAQAGELVAGLAVHDIVGVEALPQQPAAVDGDGGDADAVAVLDAGRILGDVADGG